MYKTILSTLCLSVLFACNGNNKPSAAAPATNKTEASQATTPQTTVPLVLWHTYRDAEASALKGAVDAWNQTEAGKKTPIQLEASPYDGFADKLGAAIPNGNGPDLFIFAHDRIGGWAKSSLLLPLQERVDDALIDSFWPETLPPLEFQEQLYGLPLAFKSAVLFYRSDLIQTPPKDTDELLAMAKANTKDGVTGLLYPHSSLFHHSPWLFGFGGSLLQGETPKLDTPENEKSLAFAKSLVDSGVIPKEVDPSLLASLFNANKAAMVINGPWFRGEISKDIKYMVAPIPVVKETGKAASPFLTVEAVFVSKQSKQSAEAFAFAKYLATEGAKVRLLEGKQSVAAKAAYELPEAKSDAVLQVFLTQLKSTTPTPNLPQMNAIWSPFDRALEAVMRGSQDPATALQEAQSKANTN